MYFYEYTDTVLSGLGQISYEIYLWHVTVMYVFGEWIKIYDEIARRKEMEVKQEDSSQTL